MNMGERLCFLICLIILICIGYSESQINGNFCGKQLPCDNGQCINREKWCDDETDCHDESDEKYCRTSGWLRIVDNKCTEQHFKCGNAQCVPVVTKCDGYNNCIDGSDEDYCDENSFETDLISESEELYKTSYEDFWESSETTTDEASFPDSFENPSSPEMVEVPSTTPDYYSRVRSEYINQQKQSVRYQEFDYKSLPDYHRHPYPGVRNEHSQQNRYPDAHYNTHSRIPPNGQNLHQSQTSRSSPQYSGGSDTAPTASFPSNEQRPLPPLPGYPLPLTTNPIISPSLLSVDKDAGRLGHKSHYQPQSQITYRAREDSYAPIFMTSDVRGSTNGYRNQYSGEGYSPYSPPRNSTSSAWQETALPPFHFSQNYTQQFAYRYKDSIQRAGSWIFDQRDRSYGWGIDTPRALVALSLINNSFLSNVPGNNFMKKSLQMHLGVKLLTELDMNNSFMTNRNSIKLAQYINALLGTCQDPRDFFGQDLVERLWQMKNDVLRRERFVNPFIYITLCQANASVTEDDIEVLNSALASKNPNQRSKDIQILATTALACLQYDKPKLELNGKVEKAFNDLRSRKLSDGSFGNVHSTAIAAQALMSGNIEWDPVQTLDYLKQHQSEDGSFGDMLATYYILPALSGRSLLHLRNTRCEPPPTNEEGPQIRISYTVKIGYPPTASIPNDISVPAGTNFFNILHISQLLNPVFKFSYYNSNGKIGVHAISGVVNDPEHGFYWHLYELGSQKALLPNRSREYTDDIRRLYPADSEELVYWYHNL